MRALEIVIFMICIAISLPLIPILLPGFNGGAGLDTGSQDLSATNAFNWSQMQGYKPSANPGFIEQASYFFNLAVLALSGIATLLFSSITLAPSLLNIFGVNPVLQGVLLAGFAITIILAWLQIAKGDDWSGRR